MTKKPSEKNKTWEKDRRNRLNKAFEELAKLLPLYDPTVNWSKIEIIQKSIEYIGTFTDKQEKLLESNDPKAFDACKELLEAVKFLRSRNSQLAELLTKAKISIPAVKFPKLITDNPLVSKDSTLDSKHQTVEKPTKSSKLKNNSTKGKLSPKPGNVKSRKKVDTKKAEASSVAIPKETNELTKTTPPTTTNDAPDPIRAAKSTEHTTTNAIISTGVLIPVISYQPAILPQVNTSAILAVENSQASLPKCRILKIETLPRLTNFPNKLARFKDEKLKILPCPVLKLHIRQSENKVPIPSLKRNIITVKRKCNPKRKLSNGTNERSDKKRKLPASNSRESIKKCESEEKIKNATVDQNNVEFNQNKTIFNEDRNNLDVILQPQFPTNIDGTSKIDNRLSLTENVLPDEYFSTLQIQEVNPNSNSVSPTAAFLLSFPVVNPGGGGKNISEAEESAENSQQKYVSSLNEGLENLNSFFKSKEYYGYCNQGYDLSEKVLYEKIIAPNKSLPGNKLPRDAKLNVDISAEKHFAEGAKLKNVQYKIIDLAGREEQTPKTETCSISKGMDISISTAENFVPQMTLVSHDSNYKAYNVDSVATTSIFTSTKPICFSYNETLSQHSKPTCLSSKPSTSESFMGNLPTLSYSFAINTSLPTNIQNNVQFVPETSLPYDPLKNLSVNNEKTITLPSYIVDRPICFPPSKPEHSLKNLSQPTKFNSIPNPIPVALQHPSNFPTNNTFYSNLDKSSVSLTNQTNDLSSKSRGIFDVDSMFVNFSANSSLIVPQAPQASIDLSVEGKHKTNVHTILDSHSVLSKLPSLSPVKQNAISTLPVIYGKSYLESSFLTEQAFSSFTQSASADMIGAKSQPKTGNFAPALQPLPAAESLPGVIPPSNVFNMGSNSVIEIYKNIDSSDMNTPKKIDLTNSSNKSSLLFGIDNTPQFPMPFPSTSNYGYSSILPETNCTFTFSLTSTSSTPSSTNAVSSQSQTYFPYSTINQSTPLNTYTPSIDFQTPFTFSLTPCTSSEPLTVPTQTNINSYTKTKFSIDGPILSKQFPSVPNTSLIPELPLPTTSYSSSSLTFNPLVTNNKVANSSVFPETNFSFSLTKPQTTATTASSDLIKPLTSCNASDLKYQSLFNTYNYDSYSHVFPRETTTFTFALTNPTDTIIGTQPGTQPKATQPFNSTFSIETTLGSGKPLNFQNQQQTVSPNLPTATPNSSAEQKNTEISKVICPPEAKDASASEHQNQEKHTKTPQKTHVNWMTSYQAPETVESSQHCPFYPAYPVSEFTDKNGYFSHTATDDILPSWSPSKVIDTSHLFPSIPGNSYFNDINFSVANVCTPAKSNVEPQKTQPKSDDAGKNTEATGKQSDQTTMSSQGKFLSISQLMDPNTHSNNETSDEQASKGRESKDKDHRKDPHVPQDSSAQQKAACKNSYSAEALISKKETHSSQVPLSSLHPLQNLDFYSTQNEPFNSIHQLMENDGGNYNSNYYYNLMPLSQGFLQEIDYSGTLPGEETSEKESNYCRKSTRAPNASKIGRKHPNEAVHLPNLTVPRDNQTEQPVATLAPILDSFETIQYGNNCPQSGNWYEFKTSTGNLTTPNEAALPSFNHSGSGNTGNNLTNFNLSTICPEISEKVVNDNSNW